jgi:hypothetical protein
MILSPRRRTLVARPIGNDMQLQEGGFFPLFSSDFLQFCSFYCTSSTILVTFVLFLMSEFILQSNVVKFCKVLKIHFCYL